MLTTREAREYFKDYDLTNEQVENFIHAAYSIVNDILDELYETKD